MTELRKGSQGPEVGRWFDYFTKWASSYAFLLGKRDLYYGGDEETFTRELQRRLGLPITGRFGDAEASRTGYRWTGTSTPPPAPPRREGFWIFTAPGSGASWDVGPSFEVGKWCEAALGFHHQPIGYPIGGYLGLMGGPPDLSYNEVIAAQGIELERLLDINPDVQAAMRARASNWSVPVKFRAVFSGYSQSADGMEDALVRLFGDGGKYERLRDCILGVPNFGNPSKAPSANTGVQGWNPAGWGIARKVRPGWLSRLVVSITNPNDFYACVPDSDAIRPGFYAIIVQAELSLPFFVHVLKIAGPIILGTLPIFGPFLGPLAPIAIAGATGLTAFLPLLSGLMGQAQSGGDEEVDRKLIEMLSVTGLIKNVPALIGLVGALPGLQKHGEYHLPQAEFQGRTGIQVACDVIRGYRL